MVSNPATLVSICNELELIGDRLNFQSAIYTQLENEDFFIGKNKDSMKDWGGYENSLPTVGITFIFRESNISIWPLMRSLTGQFEIRFEAPYLNDLVVPVSQLEKINEGIFAAIVEVPNKYLNEKMNYVAVAFLNYRFLNAPSVQVPVIQCDIDVTTYGTVGHYSDRVAIIPLYSNILEREFAIDVFNTIITLPE